MTLPEIRSDKALAALIGEIGFLPMFRCAVPGFSLEDCTPKELWFADGVEGPWEWKGYVLGERIAYGKLYNGKAGFISRDWLPDFCNYRRNGYDFEGFFEDGFASHKSRAIVEALARGGPLLSRVLKERCGYRPDGEKGFDSVIAQLQMQSFVSVKAFEYARDRFGRPYGWGVARYALTEQIFGADAVNAADDRTPEESLFRMQAHLSALLPDAADQSLLRLLVR